MKSLLTVLAVSSLLACATSCNSGNGSKAQAEPEEMAEEQKVEETLAVEEGRVENVEAVNAEEDEADIRDFITNMYEQDLYAEKDFIETHCSKALQQYLKEQYEYDGEGYAFWLFRTSSQDGKPGAENVKSKVLSVTKDSEGWYHYTFTDGGWHGENKIRLHMENGKVVMDELKCVYDEAASQYN